MRSCVVRHRPVYPSICKYLLNKYKTYICLVETNSETNHTDNRVPTEKGLRGHISEICFIFFLYSEITSLVSASVIPVEVIGVHIGHKPRH